MGLVSYLLVIYYQNVKSYGAGMLTVLSNCIGDVALLMVIAWIINFGSWSFVYYLEFLSGSVEIELISFLGQFGQLGKISAPTGIRSPDRPAHSESLYRFAVPGTSRQEILTVFNNVPTRYEDDLRVGGSYFQRLP